MDLTENAPLMLPLLQQDLKYADGMTSPLSTNTFAATSTTKDILDTSCKMYEGDINHTMGECTKIIMSRLMCPTHLPPLD